MDTTIDELETGTVQPEEDNIRIVTARIHNFRSLQDVEVTLDSTTVLIGENNSGKTSFLEALHSAIGAGRRMISEEDIFIGLHFLSQSMVLLLQTERSCIAFFQW